MSSSRDTSTKTAIERLAEKRKEEKGYFYREQEWHALRDSSQNSDFNKDFSKPSFYELRRMENRAQAILDAEERRSGNVKKW